MSPAKTALDLRQRAEETAATLPALLVAALRIAATVQQGVHGRRQPGSGETFWQFRRYQPGDPASVIDWRQSAKSVPLYVRQQEWEASQSIWLWCDTSASMDYSSAGVADTKARRAKVLLLAIAALLLRAGEQVAMIGHGRRPAHGTAALSRFAETLLREPAANDDGASGLPPRESLPRHAQVVLIGDFLDPTDSVHGAVKWLTGGAISGHLLQVLDPAEETLPFTGRARFAGLEGEETALIGRIESVREEYRRRLAAQRAALTAITRSNGWTFLTHRTDRPPESALLALYLALSGHAGIKR
ncbi:MAG: DUF58 domain-containing protein [Alphaproteobacteria bacterium]|jgi:uncharacterized protein (DUF58 family)